MQNPDMEKILRKVNPSQSIYDPGRENVGKIYRDLQMKGDPSDCIEIGDMARELTTSLIEDINQAIESFDKRDKPYYLMVEEKRDLQMKNALCRRLHYFGYRPYPEDNTTVFWKDPKSQDLRFCWCLPHWAEMDTTLQVEAQFEPEYITRIKAWKAYDLRPFGFYWAGKEKWLPDPKWKDKSIEAYRRG